MQRSMLNRCVEFSVFEVEIEPFLFFAVSFCNMSLIIFWPGEGVDPIEAGSQVEGWLLCEP